MLDHLYASTFGVLLKNSTISHSREAGAVERQVIPLHTYQYLYVSIAFVHAVETQLTLQRLMVACVQIPLISQS